MSAALQLPFVTAGSSAQRRQRCAGPAERFSGPLESAVRHLQKRFPDEEAEVVLPSRKQDEDLAEPVVSYAFYRKHTEKLLQRYIQASFLIGRSPTLLSDSVDQGWSSCRRIRTFEDALIFVIDIESCLKKLCKLDLQMISRVVVQNNTQPEAAALIGISTRLLNVRLPEALDRLTESLVKADLLSLPGQ